jgi:SAM-dependent methyltransferase
MSEERIYPTISNLESYLDKSPEHRIRYELACDFVKGLNCADIACGVGYGSHLLGKIAKSVQGYDLSDEALIHARKNFLSKNVTFYHADKFKNSKFETIISLETIEHMDEEAGDKFLKNISENLQDKGLLVISTDLNHTELRHNVTPFHPREYNFQEFRDKLENAGFYIKKWYGLSNIVSERMTKNTFGFSIANVLHFGIHKIIPSSIRKYLSNIILGKNTENSVSSIKLVEDNLAGCFCQIAICTKTYKSK